MPTTHDIDRFWDWGDPAGSEARFRDLLAGADDATAAELLTQVARAQGLQQRFDDGHATLDAIVTKGARVEARILLERGRLFNSAGNPEEAVPYFLRATRVAESAGDIGLEIDAMHMLGIAAPADQRLGWNERAISRAESSDDERARRWLGSLLNNTAWTYHDHGEFARALVLFQRALEWQEENGSRRTIQIARWSVARAQRSLGEFEQALAAQYALIWEMPEHEPDGHVFEEIGECLVSLGRPHEARAWFRRAVGELEKDQWLVSSQPDRLERLRALSLDEE